MSSIIAARGNRGHMATKIVSSLWQGRPFSPASRTLPLSIFQVTVGLSHTVVFCRRSVKFCPEILGYNTSIPAQAIVQNEASGQRLIVVVSSSALLWMFWLERGTVHFVPSSFIHESGGRSLYTRSTTFQSVEIHCRGNFKDKPGVPRTEEKGSPWPVA
jgi:hypothetical protein